MLKWILSTGLVRAFAMNEVRHLATAAAGFVAAWLISHGAAQSDAANIAQGVSAIVIGLAGYGFSQWFDAKRPSATIALPNGKVVIVGKASDVSPADEPAETAALNREQVGR